MDPAQPYQLPDHLQMAEAGLVAAHAKKSRGIVLPRIPITLPEESIGT
ncbi:hypothetical protein ABIG04_004662 [Bradyrhizobium japonicum]